MKKIIASILFIFSAFAVQAGDTYKIYDKQASDIARRMANQIELNELEYIQVKKYTLEKIETIAYIRNMYQTNPMMMAERIHEAEELFNNRVTYLLNAKQFDNYLALGKSFKSELFMLAEDRR